MEKQGWIKYGLGLLLIAAVAYQVVSRYVINITADTEYGFFPRAELGALYRKQREEGSQDNTTEGTDPHLESCRFTAVKYPRDQEEYIISAGWYPADYENETVRLLTDYGEMPYDPGIELETCRFAGLFGKYKKLDIMSRDLTIENIANNVDSDLYRMGCVIAVYITPNRNLKTITSFADDGKNVIPTRNGTAFLKEFYVLHVYEQDDTFSTPTYMQYRIMADGAYVAECSVPLN